MPGVQRRSAMQDGAQAEQPGAAEAAGADWRALPGMRQRPGAAHGPFRRVRLLLRLSGVQVHQAEPGGRDEVPEVRRRRYRRAQDAFWHDVLRLHALSEVRLHGEWQAGAEEVPGMRIELPDPEDAEVGRVPALPQ